MGLRWAVRRFPALVMGLCAPLAVWAQGVAIPMPGHGLRGSASAARWNALRLAGPSPALAQMRAACAIGSPAQAASPEEFQFTGRGPTPPTVNGATTVTAVQANCLIQHFPGRILVADAAGEGALPGSFDISFAGRRYARDETQDALERALSYATHDKTTPILAYCHGTTCGLSFYASQRLVAAGYTSVLWLREGMEGWKAAGYAFTTEPAKWNRAMQSALGLWRQCIEVRSKSPQGADAAAMAVGPIRACKTREDALYAAIGPWYSEKAADGTITSLRQGVVNSMKFIAESNASAAKQKAKEDDDERRWQVIEHANLPANQVHTAFEWCVASPWDGAHGHTRYFTSVYPARIPNLDPLDEYQYAQLNVGARSGRGGRFQSYINQMNREDGLMLTFCFNSPTEAEASTSKRAFMTNRKGDSKTVQDTAWKP